MNCKCEKCGREYIYSRKSGHTTKRCNSCQVNIRRFGLKIKSVKYKGGKCVRCGYNTCLQAMCFHHLDPSKKDFKISGSHAKSWENHQNELDKCILLCHNCHNELHAGIWTYP